jgi:predicted nucleotidyltransferase
LPVEHGGSSFVERFTQKVTFLKELLDLTELENRAIEGNEASELAGIIKKKQILIRRIDDIDELNQKVPVSLSDQTNQQLLDLKNQAREILSKLVVGDKQNRDLLKKKVKKAKAELAELRRHRQARKAYASKDDGAETSFLAR